MVSSVWFDLWLWWGGIHVLTIFEFKLKTFFLLMCCEYFLVMAGAAPEGSQFDARQYDSKMTEL